MRYVFHRGTLGAFCEFIKRDKIGFIFRYQIAWWKPARKENCMAGALSPVSLAPRVDDEKRTKNEWKGNEKKPSSRLLCLISHHTAISLPAVCPVRMAKHCSVHWQTFVCFGIMLSSPNISRKARAARQEPLHWHHYATLSDINNLDKVCLKKKSASFFFSYRNVWLQLR